LDLSHNKIENIDNSIKMVDSDTERKELINKIQEINVLLDSTMDNYTTVVADKKLSYLKEKIEPEMISKIFDKYISDTQSLVNDLKSQMGKGESLVNNSEIFNNIKKIEESDNKKITNFNYSKNINSLNIHQIKEQFSQAIKNNIKLQNIDINNSLNKSINNMYYIAKVKLEFETDKGQLKKKTETYLVQAESFFKWGINSIKGLGNVIENKELIKASKLPQNQELEIASKAQKYFKKFEKADFFNISQNKYLQKKLINQQIIEGIKFTKDNKIVLPLQNNKGEIQTLQFIDQNGKKSFLKGGKKQGNYFIVSKNKITQSSTIYLAEGFATAVSINMATNSPVVVAFDAGNIEAVLKNLKEKFADKNFVITADNDLYSEKNIGLQKANLAGQKYGAKVIIPNFNNLVSLNSDINHHLKPTDFNDLHQIAGLEIVKNQIHNSTQMIAKHYEFEMS